MELEGRRDVEKWKEDSEERSKYIEAEDKSAEIEPEAEEGIGFVGKEIQLEREEGIQQMVRGKELEVQVELVVEEERGVRPQKSRREAEKSIVAK